VLLLWQEQRFVLQDYFESQLQQMVFRRSSRHMGVVEWRWICSKVPVMRNLSHLEDHEMQQNAKLSPGNGLGEYVAVGSLEFEDCACAFVMHLTPKIDILTWMSVTLVVGNGCSAVD
jgi:hypothetical protein